MATVVATASAGAVYVPYSRASLNGPRGGSPVGLAFGGLATAAILFCALLGVRKKVPTWRVGRSATWMRAHIWLGLLSLPLVLFHAGFAAGGPLSMTLMVLLTLVILSGVHGLILQNLLPRLMTRQVETETIFEQIPHVIEQLREEAIESVESVCGPLYPEAAQPSPDSAQGAADVKPRAKPKAKQAAAAVEGSGPLRDFWFLHLETFLTDRRLGEEDIAVPARSQALFIHLRRIVPPGVQKVVDHVSGICEERRQLDMQISLHHWLHSWLFVHTPLSAALLLLVVAHAILSFKY